MKIFALLVGCFVLSLNVLGQVRVAPLDIVERTLDNGMKIVSVRDTTNPSVSVRVWYRVGGKDDPPGRSGFAHMFEHMMFKATKNMPDETFDRLTEDVGGYNNASTWPDYTNYFQVVPSNHLERILWAESDRMVNLNVTEKSFVSERDVVKEEFRQGVLAPPYGRFYWLMDERSFLKHPYRRGVIGNLEELSSATREDAEKFYRTYYRPDNAVLIVVGDFDQKQLDAWVDKYFGPVAKPSEDIPRVSVDEPEWTKERRYNETGPRVPFPAIAIIYRAPKTTSEDVAALRLAGSILSGGASSRLNQIIVREQQIAQQAWFDMTLNADGGRMGFVAIASEKGSPESLESAWLSILTKIQTEGVTFRELEKAKIGYLAGAIQMRETNDGKASLIERAITYRGDAGAVNRELDEIQAVTVDDIKRVMNRYFTPKNRVVLVYSQETKSIEGAEK